MAFPASSTGVRATSMVAYAASAATRWVATADSGAYAIGARGSSRGNGRGGGTAVYGGIRDRVRRPDHCSQLF